MTPHTPTTGTGLVGSWHVSGAICVRSDLALCAPACLPAAVRPSSVDPEAPGHLGGVQWLDDVPEGYWRELAAVLWRPTDTGQQRRPAGRIAGRWTRIAHILAAPLDLGVVQVPAWVAPALYRPDGLKRQASLVSMPGGDVVVVSDGGEVVAFVPIAR